MSSFARFDCASPLSWRRHGFCSPPLLVPTQWFRLGIRNLRNSVYAFQPSQTSGNKYTRIIDTVVTSAAVRGNSRYAIQYPAMERLEDNQQHAGQKQWHNKMCHHLKEHDAHQQYDGEQHKKRDYPRHEATPSPSLRR